MVLSFSIVLVLFLLALGTFLWVLTHERRSLWSGMTLVWTIITFGLFTAVSLLIAAEVFSYYSSSYFAYFCANFTGNNVFRCGLYCDFDHYVYLRWD